MTPTMLAVAAALALGTLAACDRPNPEQRPATSTAPATTAPATGTAGTGSSTTQSNSPTTPANVGAPSASEKASGSQPVQGQVDPKQNEQRQDFQQKGDGAGPKPGG